MIRCPFSSKNRKTDNRRKYHEVVAKEATTGVMRPDALLPSKTEIDNESAPPDIRKIALANESIRDRISRQSSALFSTDAIKFPQKCLTLELSSGVAAHLERTVRVTTRHVDERAFRPVARRAGP